MPIKTPINKIECNLDGYPVKVETYQSIIRIKDEEGNTIDIHKRKGRFHLFMDGIFSFKK